MDESARREVDPEDVYPAGDLIPDDEERTLESVPNELPEHGIYHVLASVTTKKIESERQNLLFDYLDEPLDAAESLPIEPGDDRWTNVHVPIAREDGEWVAEYGAMDDDADEGVRALVDSVPGIVATRE